ncbi:hypothetical protein SERLADRAFT_470197 [Serpula lacrymans var. lacrymans S7.9]|uniref:Uncharacterized protein n=1 Tax=Serpula lacrymans var. lacrymans (strain S7.9) TaxID=578457 RepID=F8NYZ6_SERL9|nr:uncharacterized protein SERLADRAFT_470197 [Serpula lacrymans var. lacrymans S7.9]EGO23816.1 hypothetical protein SERLADRAFT_470197 [Serpula lacrymans var. lacrymans S7.9]
MRNMRGYRHPHPVTAHHFAVKGNEINSMPQNLQALNTKSDYCSALYVPVLVNSLIHSIANGAVTLKHYLHTYSGRLNLGFSVTANVIV